MRGTFQANTSSSGKSGMFREQQGACCVSGKRVNFVRTSAWEVRTEDGVTCEPGKAGRNRSESLVC